MINIQFNMQRRSGLVLGSLNPNETFVMLDDQGEPYEHVFRVLHSNSNYLKYSRPDRVFIINLQNGKIHYRSTDARVARVDINMVVTRKR